MPVDADIQLESFRELDNKDIRWKGLNIFYRIRDLKIERIKLISSLKGEKRLVCRLGRSDESLFSGAIDKPTKQLCIQSQACKQVTGNF